jgi:hypothetical protein
MLMLMIVAAWFFVSVLVMAMCVTARAGDEQLRAQANHLPLRRADRAAAHTMQASERKARGSSVSDPHDARAA